MTRHLLIRSLALGGSVLLGLLLAEGLSRLIVGPPSREFQVYDQDLGWRNDSAAAGWRVTVDYQHWQHVNEKGIRGEYVPSYVRDDPDVFRVLVLGDSFAEGAGVSDEQVFPALLAQRLNQAADGSNDYEVINFGVSGYSTDQELLAFEREGAKYNADLTILAFVYNDLEGNIASYSSGANKPRFELKPSSDSSLEFIPNAPRRAESAFLKLKTELRQRSRLYTLATEAVHKLRFTQQFLGALDVIEASDGEPTARPFDFFRANQDESTSAAWSLTEALAGRMKDAVECNGGRFCVVYVPPSFAVHDEDWEQFQVQFGDGYGRHVVRDRLKDLANRQGIEFWDLTSSLSAAAAKKGGRVYYRHDTHWTPEGHAVVAEALETIVKQQEAALHDHGKQREELCSARELADAN